MKDTFVKTVAAEPHVVSRALVRLDAYRKVAAIAGETVEASIHVVPAYEGASVAITLEARERDCDRWDTIAAQVTPRAKELLARIAAALQPTTRTLAAA